MSKKKFDRTAGKKAVVKSLRDLAAEVPRTRKQALVRSALGFSARTAEFPIVGNANITDSGQTPFYSPYLSTDMLEQPRSTSEKRRWYRHYYSRDPFVRQTIDMHVEVPLSRVRLALPEAQDHKYAKEILNFYEAMCRRLNLWEALRDISRDYWLYGMSYPFHEWDPDDKVWNRIVMLDPDHVKAETVPFSNHAQITLIPPPQLKALIKMAETDPLKAELLDTIPEDLREYLAQEAEIPLDTDPETGSFVYRLLRKTDGSSDSGQSILECVMTVLIYRDKLRQAQSQIASRAMTPRRVVSAEGLSMAQLDDLRDQIDQSLAGPDYSIVTNFPVEWNEMGANDRLLNLADEYTETENQLFVGLGITKDILTGQSTYSGSRISLEIINARYMLFREMMQQYVEDFLFRPVALANDFVGLDKDGNKVLLYPKLQFNRMVVRDTQDTFDALFNLYQKGSLPISVILDLLNIDPVDVQNQLEEDLGTVNDARFNDLLGGAYGTAGNWLVENTDMGERMAAYLRLKVKPQPAGDGAGGGGGFGGGGGMDMGMGGAPMGDMGEMPPEGDVPPEGDEGAPPPEGGEGVPGVDLGPPPGGDAGGEAPPAGE
jgi:hypothetical protein